MMDNGWMDGRIDRRMMDGWVDGWKEGRGVSPAERSCSRLPDGWAFTGGDLILAASWLRSLNQRN